jgi:hypothetical protein
VILGFKKKATSNYTLRPQEIRHGDEWHVEFQLFLNDSQIAVSDWAASNHSGAIWLLDFIKMNDLATLHMAGTSVSLPFKKLMPEFEGQEGYLQRLIEFPALFEGGIHLESHGLLHSDGYNLSYNWLNGNGRQITQCERRVGFLIVGDRKYLLPVHAWKMAENLDAIKISIGNSDSVDSRLRVLEEFERLRSLLPETERSRFSESSDIASLKLHFANAFRIEAVPEDNSYKIRPVLLRRREDQESGSSIFESILPPSEQNKYAEYFSNSTKLLPYYNLGVGKYLIIGEQLNKALSVVHKIQHASAEERLKFLRNPKAEIAESLDGIIDDDQLDNIFSDRVTGIGEWNAKVIPWMQIPPGDWIPESELPDVPKGIDIGGVKIQLTSASAKELLKKIETAQQAGVPFVQHAGVQIPASDNARASVAAIVPRSPEKISEPKEPKPAPVSQNAIMLVKENLETVEFAVHRVPRTTFPLQRGVPDAVRTTPKPHQEDAYNWLCEHFKVGSRGVLLADDMGLGKTFQSLMFFSWLRSGIENGELAAKPLLIVAPTGLLKNWEAEIERHLLRDLGNLVRVFGSELRTIKSGQSLNTSKLRNAGLVLTTYDTLTRYQTSFGAVSFSAVIFDEVQKLKNPGIQNYSAASSLNCDFWIGMTGTPVENRLCDLWSITDILQPGMLGSIKEFSNKYEKAMLEGGDTAMQRTMELQDGLITATEKAPAFMLRRMKREKLPGLPPKYIHEHPLPMPEEQMKAYNQVLIDVKNSEGRQGAMLEALHKLRAYSLHPDYKKQQQYVSDDDFIKRSARLLSCFKILDEIHAKNEKALIFIEYSEWHRPEFLRDIIKNRYSLKELPMVINGQVDSAARQARVDAFQDKKNKGVFDVMLLSPRAGGVGLTLTAANHVIHLTRWWNPAVEDQATDRIYRIGQESPVHIHYPIAIHPDLKESCFDYNLHQLLDSKRKLSTKVLIAAPDEGGIMDALIGKTFNTDRSFEISLDESYVLSGQEFEDIALQRLQKFAPSQGFQVRSTPRSWDGGADMIIETTDGQIAAIVQCKHVSRADKSPEINVDLERAFKNYGCEKNTRPVMKIGVTNSSKVNSIDRQWENLLDLHLIISGDQGLKPEMLFKSLKG